MTALRPGTSPPPVRMPMRFFAMPNSQDWHVVITPASRRVYKAVPWLSASGPQSRRCHHRGSRMTSKSWIRRLGAPLIAFVLTVAPSVSQVHAVDDARKVSVVSFGLFGDQGVFRSEATGAAQVVAGRFRSGPINVQYNSKKGGGATIEGLATSLQVAANGLDAENDVLFLILTSHGSRAGLVGKAGLLTQTLTP